ncbi:MAG: AMIN-like domain-containing (lipo)protein, partial [Acidimicrobiales bacterium]
SYQSTVPWSYGAHIVSPGQFSASGFQTFRDLVWGSSFEGESTLGLGVRARLPYRVFKLAGPGTGSRLVIDVAHRW